MTNYERIIAETDRRLAHLGRIGWRIGALTIVVGLVACYFTSAWWQIPLIALGVVIFNILVGIWMLIQANAAVSDAQMLAAIAENLHNAPDDSVDLPPAPPLVNAQPTGTGFMLESKGPIFGKLGDNNLYDWLEGVNLLTNEKVRLNYLVAGQVGKDGATILPTGAAPTGTKVILHEGAFYQLPT